MIDLTPHPSAPPKDIEGVSVSVERDDRTLNLIFGVDADPATLVLPAPAKPYRTDRLWESTCFELFIRGAGNSYSEFNFAPSSQWAAYAFDEHREGMRPLAVDEPPSIWFTNEGNGILLGARISLLGMPARAQIGLSAIIHEQDGTKSYWALAHPDGPPDFHHDACFAASLPPIG